MSSTENPTDKKTPLSVEVKEVNYDDEDEFEEFELMDWAGKKDVNALGNWEEDLDAAGWDEEDPSDDFLVALKQELARAMPQN